MKLDKSVHRLDAIDAERPCSLKALLHASLIASILAALLAHTHNLNTRPQQTEPHVRGPPASPRLALQLAVSCQSIAQAFDLQGEEATRAGQDRSVAHTWRRIPIAPSPIRLRSAPRWKRQPIPRKKGHACRKSWSYKAAA